MGIYNIYDENTVRNAENNFNSIYNSAPTYEDSEAARAARKEADRYAGKYQSMISEGYSPKYTAQTGKLTQDYLNNKFNWSIDKSAQYQQEADKARREGQKAQANAQAAYSANTGGYGNSYAQAAGQKAYNAYMDELAEKIPSIKSQAKASWSEEQEQTLEQIGLMQNLDNMQYQRYRDAVSDAYDFMNYYENKYTSERGLDMSAFQSELSKWQARLSAAQSNLSTTRQLAQQQYEHDNISADTAASFAQSRAQTDEYYKYMLSRVQ